MIDVSIGIPVLFDDLDGNGSLAVESEPVLGAVRGQLVLYTELAPSGATTDIPLTAGPLPSGWSVGTVLCDAAQRLTGIELAPNDTRFDVWLFSGVIDNSLDDLVPKTCLMPL